MEKYCVTVAGPFEEEVYRYFRLWIRIYMEKK